MEKINLALVLLILAIIFLYFFKPKITGLFVAFGQPTNAKWWNTSWHYRLRIDIYSPVDRTNWPVEISLNFSDLIPSGTFDENSIRVFEYSSNGEIIQEVPSQFDKDEDYNANYNAKGTLVFILNGTTLENTNRTFYVYYDILENGQKQKPSYATNLTYYLDATNQTINVNTTSLAIYIDTARLNISGIYKVVRKSDEATIINVPTTQKPTEFIELTNDNYNFTFDLRNNVSLIVGPVRITLVQKGYEVFENNFSSTNEAFLTKKYYFYNFAGGDSKGSFVRVEENVTNLKGYGITRKSLPASFIALDLNRSFPSPIDSSLVSGTSTNPYSYYIAASQYANYFSGIITINYSTSNLFAKNETAIYGRIGIHLNETLIPAYSFVYGKALVYFGAWTDPGTEFESIRKASSNPEIIYISKPEKIFVNISIKTNATVYNRNETILIEANVTYDPYNLTRYLNATLNLGTLDKSDDITIQLFDDGTHGDKLANDKVYTNTFTLSNTANVGEWKINVSAFDENFVYLDSSQYSFNVTDLLNVNVSVLNKVIIEGRTNYALIEVRNYRNDTLIAGALINCSYDSYVTNNVTDYNNGTYLVNFTSPPFGSYVLVCNASKDGNFGQGRDAFSTQASKTQLEAKAIPSYVELKNVTFYSGEPFDFELNVSNLENAIAYNTNISFQIPEGWSYSGNTSCGDIQINSYCTKNFTITTKNNILGNFTINITVSWRNPDETINTTNTTLNVSVLSNPKINIFEDYISGEAKDGLNISLTNFTVISEGNVQLENIQFYCKESYCSDFNVVFEPSSISSLPQGQNSSVRIYVSPPLGYSPGSYNLTINATSNKTFDTFILNVILQPKTNVSIDLAPSSYTSSNITQYNGDSFAFLAFVKNLLNSSARNVNISILLPSGWSSNSSLEYCGDLKSEENCSKSFNVSIPPKTSPATYTIKVYVNWTNLDNSLSSNSTNFYVTVSSTSLIDVIEEVRGEVLPSMTSYVSNFTIFSAGNSRVYNINYYCSIGKICKDFVFNFTPSSISFLDAGKNASVAINVTVPFNYLAGNYSAIFNVTSDSNFDTFNLSLRILENRSWDMQPEYCKKSEYPSEGIACEVKVFNLGNANITFNITPEFGNYTKVNVTSFVVSPNSSYIFAVLYNVTNATEDIYNSTFNVSAIESANPQYKLLTVTLLPYTPPTIIIYFDKEEIEQTEKIKIFANVSSKVGASIKSVYVNVTQPNGSIDSSEMQLNATEGNVSIYFIQYPFNNGSTFLVGYYNVSVIAEDSIGNIGINTSSFKVRKSFVVFLSTYSNKYYQGDTASIYYSAKDFENNPLENVSVSFKVFNPNQTLIFFSSNFSTNKDGLISPPPTFFLPSDSLPGNYTLQAISIFYEGNVSTLKTTNYTFSVFERAITVTGLFADISTAVVWYPNNIMKFGILVYNGEGKPVDVDFLNLTVYDPAGNVYFSIGLNDVTRESTGFYSYKYAMPLTTPTGMYLAVLNVSKGEFQTMKLASFRVAQGGPYDLKVVPLEYVVAQGMLLDFNVIIINMGEVSQDVFLEYWVSSPDGTKYFSSSEFVYTPALKNLTLWRTAYIFPDQPVGLYFINVRMTYDNVQPPLLANATFLVAPGNVTTVKVPIPTGQIIVPTPLPVPTANLTASILIEKYSPKISVARNSLKTELVTVRNTGSLDLSNISLMLVGIPLTWFNITPSSYFSLKPNEALVFAITFNIPKDATIGNYSATLIASSNLISDSKQVEIVIYRSMKELLEEEISRLEDELASLVIDTKIAEKEGKDVSVVKDMINSIRDEILKARDNLSKENYESAMKNVENAKILLERARDLLSKLTVKAKAFVIPFWLIAAIAIAILAITGTVLILRKKKKEGEKIRLPTFLPAVKLAEQIRKKPSKEEILAEKENVLRALRALEKSREEGLISEAAYRAMKKSLEEKLEKIEKKL